MKEEVKCYPYHPFVVLDDRSKMMIVRITMMVTVVIA